MKKEGYVGVGIGFSKLENTAECAHFAAKAALDNLVEGNPTFAFVYIHSSYEFTQATAIIKSVLPCEFFGVSTSRVLCHNTSLGSGILVVLLRSDDVRFNAISAEITSSEIRNIAQCTAMQLIDSNVGKTFSTAVVKIADKFVQVNPYSVILFGNSFLHNGTEMLSGVLDVTGDVFQVIGGTPSDELSFHSSHLYHSNMYSTNGIGMVLLASRVPTGMGVGKGWQPAGGVHIVTRSKGNVVYEIDNISAAKVYENYLSKPLSFFEGKDFSKMGYLHPVGILLSDGDQLLRSPIQLQDDGSLVFCGSLNEGCAIRFMTATREDIFEATREAVQRAMSSLGRAKPAVVFAFISIGHALILGDAADEQLKLISSLVGENVPIVGMYTYSEYGKQRLHSHKHYSNSIALFIIGH